MADRKRKQDRPEEPDPYAPEEPEQPKTSELGQRMAGANWAASERQQGDERDLGLPDREGTSPAQRERVREPSGDEITERLGRGDAAEPATEP